MALTVAIELDLVIFADFTGSGITLQSVGGADDVLPLTLIIQTSSCHGAPHSNDIVTGLRVALDGSGYFHIHRIIRGRMDLVDPVGPALSTVRRDGGADRGLTAVRTVNTHLVIPATLCRILVQIFADQTMVDVAGHSQVARLIEHLSCFRVSAFDLGRRFAEVVVHAELAERLGFSNVSWESLMAVHPLAPLARGHWMMWFTWLRRFSGFWLLCGFCFECQNCILLIKS